MNVISEANNLVRELADNPHMAVSALRALLYDEANLAKLKQLACEDVRFARFCERIGFETGSQWRELSRQEAAEFKQWKAEKAALGAR